MDNYPDLAGHCVFITGAARGLGKAMALKLAANGAVVGLADLVLAECDVVADEVRSLGGTAHSFSLDVAVRKLYMAAAATFAARCGRIDAVISNAMLIRHEPVEQISDETLTRMTAIGVNGCMWGAQALLAHYDPGRGGSLLNMTSPFAEKGFPETSAYSAVNGAIISLTRALATELGPRNVRVNALAPASVPTPGELGLQDRGAFERRLGSIPLRRLGHEEDNANACAFLLSSQASFINGEILHVDGGISATGIL